MVRAFVQSVFVGALAAASLYLIQTGIRGGNRKNESLIVSGYRDFLSKNVGD
jgi:hypothetical protein